MGDPGITAAIVPLIAAMLSATGTGPACVSEPGLFDYGPHREDTEAEQLAMHLAGELRAPDEEYERIRRDLALIRAAFPNLTDVIDDPDYAPDQLLVRLDPDADWTGLQGLNEFYQLIDQDNFAGDWHLLTFCDNLNAPLLVPLYAPLPEVLNVSENYVIGADDGITVEVFGPTYRYAIVDGFTDCTDGCDCQRSWLVDVDEGGEVAVVSYGEGGQPWCNFEPAACCFGGGVCAVLPIGACLGQTAAPMTFDTSCEQDHDGDGLDAACGDNCPLVWNPGQGDLDGDAVGGACDNCADGPNPDQGPAPLGQQVVAADRQTFSWPRAASVRYVVGDLSAVGAYDVAFEASLPFAVDLIDLSVPDAGEGFYYVLRPECAVGSWQTTVGAEPGRDTALPSGP